MSRVVLLVFVAMVMGAMADFNPIMTINTCLNNTLVLTIQNASDTGIVYIKDNGGACKQTTSSTTKLHVIDFNACGISLEFIFTVVIQKKANYMTGNDKQISVMCIADLDAELNVGLAGKGDDNAGQNKTVKPTAAMTLYRDGVDVSGGTIKLTDSITMVIQLDADYIEEFDIMAKECSASTITVTQSYCADVPDIFPQFTKVGQGQLSATFGGFRMTELNGGPVNMPFACTVQVCLGACPEITTCPDGSTGYGRKRRHANTVEDSGMYDVTVGAAISVATEDVLLEGSEDDAAKCMDQTLFVAMVTTLVGGTVVSTIASAVMFKKLQQKTAILTELPNHRSFQTLPTGSVLVKLHENVLRTLNLEV